MILRPAALKSYVCDGAVANLVLTCSQSWQNCLGQRMGLLWSKWNAEFTLPRGYHHGLQKALKAVLS